MTVNLAAAWKSLLTGRGITGRRRPCDIIDAITCQIRSIRTPNGCHSSYSTKANPNPAVYDIADYGSKLFSVDGSVSGDCFWSSTDNKCLTWCGDTDTWCPCDVVDSVVRQIRTLRTMHDFHTQYHARL